MARMWHGVRTSAYVPLARCRYWSWEPFKVVARWFYGGMKEAPGGYVHLSHSEGSRAFGGLLSGAHAERVPAHLL